MSYRMKTTLTQAWEAKGLTGYLLRSKVVSVLVDRFYEQPGKEATVKFLLLEIFLGAIVVALAAWMYRILERILRTADLSLTSNFIPAIVFTFALFAAFALIGVYIALAYNEVKSLGSINRYIFEHRDDEVEL